MLRNDLTILIISNNNINLLVNAISQIFAISVNSPSLSKLFSERVGDGFGARITDVLEATWNPEKSAIWNSIEESLIVLKLVLNATRFSLPI